MGNANLKPPNFGSRNIDRSRIHDVPWMETLKKLGKGKFSPVEQADLDQYLKDLSTDEIHCARALFRAYREYDRVTEEGDEKDFSTGLYFVLAQDPETLVFFYTMLHNCWLYNLALEGLKEEYGADFAKLALTMYVEEKGERPEVEDEDEEQDEEAEQLKWTRIEDSINGIISSYLKKLCDAVTNPEVCFLFCFLIANYFIWRL